MAAKRNSLWFGFLDAGGKGSPVVRDASIDTGTPSTLYLFNFKKGRILEYRRDIAEPKLRELTENEIELMQEMRKAFESARNGFTPRAMRRMASPPRRPKPEPEPELPVVDFDDDDDSMPLLDDDRNDAISADQAD
jgi:hypothetical protein